MWKILCLGGPALSHKEIKHIATPHFVQKQIASQTQVTQLQRNTPTILKDLLPSLRGLTPYLGRRGASLTSTIHEDDGPSFGLWASHLSWHQRQIT